MIGRMGEGESMPEPVQFKKIAFLTPRRDMALADFHAYWRGTHGPTVAHAPGYAAFRTRYAQNHRIGDGPFGTPLPYPGAAIFHLPGDGANEAEFSRSATYRDHVRVDEQNFIDMDRTIAMTAVEHVLRTGPGPVKLLIAGRRKEGTGAADFDRCLRQACADTLANAQVFAARVRGWVFNSVIEGSLSLPGARPAEGFAVDCVQELWFASTDDMASACGDTAYRGHLAMAERDLFAASGLFSCLVREFVFFDNGSPVPLASG
jgi:hypothetical protein